MAQTDLSFWIGLKTTEKLEFTVTKLVIEDGQCSPESVSGHVQIFVSKIQIWTCPDFLFSIEK